MAEPRDKDTRVEGQSRVSRRRLMLTNGESANSREGPTAETSRPLSPDDDHQLLFDQIATATERCELVSRRA